MADRGTYRHDRRQAAGRVASSIKHAGAKAARMFFGASPAQKKKLRRTVDKRGIKVDDLDVNALDRTKFHAPEKVGESVRLIDIAMGNAPAGGAPERAEGPPAPDHAQEVRRETGSGAGGHRGSRRTHHTDGPAPDVLPPPTPPQTEPARPTTRRPPPPRPPARPGPGAAPRPTVPGDDDDDDDEHDEGRIGLLPALAGLLALLAFALFPTSGWLLRAYAPDVAVAAAAEREAELDPWGHAWCSTKPTPTSPARRYSAGPDGHDDGLAKDDVDPAAAARSGRADLVPAAAYSEEATLTLGLLFTWLAMTLGRLRAPRAGVVVELTRAVILASLPALVGVLAILWSCEAVPSLGLPAPPEALAPLGALVREQVAPLVAPAALPAPGTAAGAWAALCVLGALLVRRALGPSSDGD